MPNSPNFFLPLTAEHLIHCFLMEFIIMKNKENTEKNKLVSNTM